MQTAIKTFFGCLFVLTLLLQGCTACNKHNFSGVNADLQIAAAKDKSIAVATSDQRKGVLSNKCSSTYVGRQRAGFGDTESGIPFADDLTKVVNESLAETGVRL